MVRSRSFALRSAPIPPRASSMRSTGSISSSTSLPRSTRRKPIGRKEILRANVEGTHQLLEAAVARKVRKVVFASSLYTYGRMHGPPFREEDLPAPTTVYGLSKLAGEHLQRRRIWPLLG